MKDWLDKLAEEILPEEDVVPRGFLSTKEIAKRQNRSVYAATRWVRRALAMGRLKRVVLRRRTRTGIARVPYYGPK